MSEEFLPWVATTQSMFATINSLVLEDPSGIEAIQVLEVANAETTWDLNPKVNDWQDVAVGGLFVGLTYGAAALAATRAPPLAAGLLAIPDAVAFTGGVVVSNKLQEWF